MYGETCSTLNGPKDRYRRPFSICSCYVDKLAVIAFVDYREHLINCLIDQEIDQLSLDVIALAVQ